MENQYNEDVIPDHVARFLRDKQKERDLETIEAEDLVDVIRDRFRDVEVGQVYPFNAFK